MSNMYAMVLFLIVITSTRSTLCVSSNNNNDVSEIYMVVDDQRTTMHDSGRAMSKANPIQIGKFHLKDGKVLTLSRKSSPSRNCVGPYQPCSPLDWCCEGLTCDRWFDGTCHPDLEAGDEEEEEMQEVRRPVGRDKVKKKAKTSFASDSEEVFVTPSKMCRSGNMFGCVTS
nr:tetratricopeptide-like helical domain-containing protein [Tanacetum cinerariifolium]